MWYSKTDGDPHAPRGYLAYADALPQWLNADDIKGHKYPEYESFTAVLDRVNKDLRENPLEGKDTSNVCIIIRMHVHMV